MSLSVFKKSNIKHVETTTLNANRFTVEAVPFTNEYKKIVS